jgi:hypothetical protein
MSYKNNLNLLKDVWKKKSGTMTCPQCSGPLTMIQLEPIYDTDEDYTPYKTVIECSDCSFKIITQSMTILGSVKSFNDSEVEIGSWAPSGSRIAATYEHSLDIDFLQKLKESGELVEFLIVNKQVVQVIG